jgi:hypothetical protein
MSGTEEAYDYTFCNAVIISWDPQMQDLFAFQMPQWISNTGF